MWTLLCIESTRVDKSVSLTIYRRMARRRLWRLKTCATDHMIVRSSVTICLQFSDG